ncbi:MAG: hypothetical protein U0230_09455 [Polyangiales bacterium]
MTLSPSKLRELEPALFAFGTFRCSLLCPIQHPGAEMVDRIGEYLQLGDSQPAKVVSLDPLVVSVYSVDLDAAMLVRYPNEFVARYGLEHGTRLVSVNVYWIYRRESDGAPFFPVDVSPGPGYSGWSDFMPLIADFLCEDQQAVEERRASIGDSEWRTLDDRTERRLAKGGTSTARDGRPTRVFWPVLAEGGVRFRTRDGEPISVGEPGATRPTSPLAWAVLLGLLAVFLYLLLRQ